MLFIISLTNINSAAAKNPLQFELAENSLREIVINKNQSDQVIVYYRTELSGQTFVQKMGESGSLLFHEVAPIPAGSTVINVFSENAEIRFHTIRKEKKQVFIDLVVMGNSLTDGYNLISFPKDELLSNILQRGDHTLVITKEKYSNILYFYRFSEEKLMKRKSITIETKEIAHGIDKYGLQDMYPDFNPMPLASANSPCKMYYAENGITITLDGYYERQGEFAHYLERINFETQEYSFRTKKLPYSKYAHSIASAVLNDKVYLLIHSKHESRVEVYDIGEEKELGGFSFVPESDFFDKPTRRFVRTYPKNDIYVEGLTQLDTKEYKELFRGNPAISVTELACGGVQIVLGSYAGTSGTFMAPNLRNPLSMLVSVAVFAASSAMRDASTFNGVENYVCIDIKDPNLINMSFTNSKSILERANDLYSEHKLKNKRSDGYLFQANRQNFLILKNRREPVLTIFSFE